MIPSTEQPQSQHTCRLLQRFASSQVNDEQWPSVSGRLCNAEHPHRSSSVSEPKLPMLCGSSTSEEQPERLIQARRDKRPTESGNSCMPFYFQRGFWCYIAGGQASPYTWLGRRMVHDDSRQADDVQ